VTMSEYFEQHVLNDNRKKNIRKPGFCCLGIVDTCMLHCKMCEKWKEDIYAAGQTEPTLEQYKIFLDQLHDITDPGFELSIGGGEAFMRADLLDLITYANKLGFKTTVASNGWMLSDEEFARKVVATGISSVILSIDSVNPAIHDEMRGVEGVHARVLKSIDNLRNLSKDIHIGLCSIIMNKTIDGIIELADWSNARRDKINSHLFMAVMQPNNTVKQDEWVGSDLGDIWPQDTAKALAIVDELIRRRKEGYWLGNSVEQLEAFKLYFKNPNAFVKKTACNLDAALHVSAVGDVFMCFRWGKLGNMKDGVDVRELWYSEEAERIREDIRKCNDNCHYLLNCFFEGDYPFISINE